MSEKSKNILPSAHTPSQSSPRQPSSQFATFFRWVVTAWCLYSLLSYLACNDVLDPVAQVGLPDGNSTSVHWAPCPGREDQAYRCGFLDVPTDYDDPSQGTTRLALSKSPARVDKKDRLGTLFINPGGPGGSGYDFTFRFALDELLEGKYDIVGFDPRGIGRTTPKVQCFPSSEAFAIFKRHTVLEQGYSIPPAANRTWQGLLEQTKSMRAYKEAEFELCEEVHGEELWFMGTTSVVKDIERMSAVLEGEHSPINFAGFSYGTILGAYLVNQLPAAKIGRVLIDGVASAPEWANTQPDLMLYNWLNSTEDTYLWFLRDCASAGPSACALALETDVDPEGSEIEQRLEAYLDGLWEAPRAIVTSEGQAGVLTSSIARTRLYQSTNGPKSWPATAALFASAILVDDPLPLYKHVSGPLFISSSQSEPSRVAVACADSPPTTKGSGVGAEEAAKEMMKVLDEVSPHFGGSVSLIEQDGNCEFWTQREGGPKGFRFTGPWNSTLGTPMLIISNTADPITPLSSGKEIHSLMGNSSRLLIQNSPGHCSLGSVSVCTTSHIKRYFLDGVVPSDLSSCEIDEGFFPSPNKTLSADVQTLAGPEQEIAQRVSATWEEWVMGRL